MSSIGQTPSSTSNIPLIINAALADYTKITGTDLSKTPFAAAIERSNSLEAILQLLQEREEAFKEHREGNRRLINCISPAVSVIQAFSGILSEAVNLIPFPPAYALFAGIDTLLAAASGVTSSYDALLELFECLGNFLKRLEVYTTIPPSPILTEIVVKIMVELLSVLALASKQIKQGRFKKFTKKLLGESEIETVLQRLDRLTQDEARITVAQTLGVVHSLVGNVKVVMEDGKASTDSIRQDLVALHQTLNEINKAKREQLRWEVQNWLSPPDPSTNQNSVRKARHKGTAAWFFESSALKEWSSRGSLLWIYGKPGAGKSTLLSAIIQDIERMHAAGLATMAYYYFDFRDVKKQDCYGLLSSLISQLSADSDACHDILSKLHSDNIRGARKPDIDTLKECMVEMLNLPGQSPIYIIVDGLDECPNFPGRPSARDEVLEFVEELVNLELPNVHICVASRPEMDIRLVLEPLTSLRISLHDETGQKEDIIKYINSVVRSDRNMRRWKEEHKQLVVDTLSEKADGMFRWIVCQVDRLCRSLPASIRDVLDDLPKTLDETYTRSLLGIDEEKREYAQRLFRCLTVSVRPLRVEELAEVLAVRFNKAGSPTFNPDWRPENPGEMLISVCSSFITVVDRGGHQVVQFSHFSVKEYLTSERLATAEERLSYFHILPEPAHTVLAHASISVLLQLDDKSDRNTICHFPLAPYAARHWVDHARFRDVSSHIQESMERLFDPSKPHFATWVWLHNIDRHWTEPMSTIHPTQPEAVPLYYASLCGFRRLVEHLIIAHSRDVNSRGGSHATPLHAASVKGHLNVVSLLLKAGADPNSRDNVDRVPLHRVSQGGQLVMAESSLEIAQLLINCGAKMNLTDDRDETPLHAAALSRHRHIAELLVELGTSLDVRNKAQQTPLHLACVYGGLEVSRLLIDRGSDINARDEKGLTPLHVVSDYGHVEAARLLLDSGSDVNARETTLWTPLHHALQYGHLDLARLFIDRGADVNAHGGDRRTPMHVASGHGHFDIVKLLVDHGADVNSRDDNGKTPLDGAAEHGFLDIVRFLIESGATVSAQDDQGWTPFHTASHCGHLYIVRFLLECGVDVNIRNKNGDTSLDLASGSGRVDVVRFLIEQGADINDRNHGGLHPLHIASQNGHLDVVRLLIDTGTPVDIRNAAQMTPLASASGGGQVKVGRFLIERGADMNARDNQSSAPLHFASRYGHLDMARMLLDHDVDPNIQLDDLQSSLHLASNNGHLKLAELLVQRGASIDVFNHKQVTPLYQAVRAGKVAMARFLIDHGANLQTADSSGWTLLHAASYHGNLRVVKLLLQRNADVDMLNKDSKTAAEVASENGKAEVAKFITEYKADANIRSNSRSTTLDSAQDGADENEVASLHTAAEEGIVNVVKSLLERGVDINGRNSVNQTPLARAAKKGNLEVLRLLIERGAEVDPTDITGWTPLHYASQLGYLEIARVLIDHGANVNARQRKHWTPIHLSVAFGHLEVVKLLFERGAELHAMNSQGQTPYEESLRRGHREIIDYLRRHGADR